MGGVTGKGEEDKCDNWVTVALYKECLWLIIVTLFPDESCWVGSE